MGYSPPFLGKGNYWDKYLLKELRKVYMHSDLWFDFFKSKSETFTSLLGKGIPTISASERNLRSGAAGFAIVSI